MTTEPTVLDCGHIASPRGCATGYAHTPDGKKVCVSCAEQMEYDNFMAQEYPMRDGAFFAYLSGDGKSLTTWTGRKLATITDLTYTEAGFGGWRRDSGRRYFRAVDDKGRQWHGNSPGKGMYARAKLSKPIKPRNVSMQTNVMG